MDIGYLVLGAVALVQVGLLFWLIYRPPSVVVTSPPLPASVVVAPPVPIVVDELVAELIRLK